MLLGFDPGRDKCGVAVIGLDRKVLYQAVIPSCEAIATVASLMAKYTISLIIMGDQTTAQVWKSEFKNAFPDVNIVTVNERFSSQEAKVRYWQLYPPQGLMALVPLGLRSPPRPVDDIVAMILIERYLSRLVSS
ncbi:putative endonuclease involved in recombination [Synechococcus sp. PCC 7502]|uniref:pre-16S rRNA-processing nuclease YqgF n=1 Tax=Synechococcus sp. PCC 7502 TaxID=1173263 RepID=UPI00029FF4D9|nr:pre-16S rRNA-processing nuclease YqgF [Synechococcus sp. PCC 7502]AFY74150.1 putative endonuclease involved in recombination [Synechococcus sp. PCC 7502]